MNQSAEAKLQQLRGKTNAQLLSLIGNRVDRGLAFVRIIERDNGDWASTEHFRLGAESACHDAVQWMQLLRGADRMEERRRLEFKLAQLRRALDRSADSLTANAAC